MIRVVADTNVLISAIIFKGLPAEFLNLAYAKSMKLVISPALLTELDGKLRLKFQFPNEQAAMVQARLLSTADYVVPGSIINAVPNDPDDNRVLECAVEGRADYIVSGDRHLLTLGSYRTIPIVKVRDFMDRIGS